MVLELLRLDRHFSARRALGADRAAFPYSLFYRKMGVQRRGCLLTVHQKFLFRYAYGRDLSALSARTVRKDLLSLYLTAGGKGTLPARSRPQPSSVLLRLLTVAIVPVFRRQSSSFRHVITQPRSSLPTGTLVAEKAQFPGRKSHLSAFYSDKGTFIPEPTKAHTVE